MATKAAQRRKARKQARLAKNAAPKTGRQILATPQQQAQISQEEMKPGVLSPSSQSSPSRINSRAAEQQQRAQTQRRAVAITTGKGQRGTSGTFKTFIDPFTGQDTREFDQSGQPIKGSGQMFEFETGAPIAPSTPGGLKAIERLEETAQTGLTQETAPRGISGPDVSRDQERSVFESLEERLEPGAQGVPDQVGFAPQEEVDQSVGGVLERAEAAAQRERAAGNPAAAQQILERAERKMDTLVRQEEINRLEEQRLAERAQANATASSLRQGVLSTLSAQLPEEISFLGPVFQGLNAELSERESVVSAFRDERLERAQNIHTGRMSMLEGFRQDYQRERDQYQQIIGDIRDDTVQTIAEQRDLADQRLQWQQSKATRQLEAQKNSEIEQATATLALIGGFGSSNGLESIEEAEREWEVAIADLGKEFAFKRADVALEFTNKYKQIQNEYRLNTFNATKEFNRLNQQIQQQGFSSSEALANAEEKVMNDYLKSVFDIRDEKTKNVMSLASVVQKSIQDEQTKKSERERAAWDRLGWAVSTYGSRVPQGILEGISKDIPDVDVSSVLSQQTLAELSKRKSGSVSGSPSSYSYSSSEEALTDLNFEGTSKNQLLEAVDRITLKFGGTGKERDRKRAEYISRINSGESTASVIESMKNDYWVTRTGPEKTRHNGRMQAQGQADLLEEKIEYYAITPDDDGPLGMFDSKVQKVGSWFGISSQEFNDLSGAVNSIRAGIVKENYGAAVTPQELKLAKSFIPDMDNKGSVFITNVRNLRNYNKYLDDKQFASDVGLPLPSPPQPVTFSGEGVSGVSKYSTDDINSILSQ